MAQARAASAVTEALNAAAWAEADLHLARAWREAATLEADLAAALAAMARREKGSARPSAAQLRLAAAADRAAFLAERIAAAARVRRLDREGSGVAPFDPLRHSVAPMATGAAPDCGASVKILAPAIVRRAGAGDEVLVRALVRPVKAAPSKAGPAKAGPAKAAPAKPAAAKRRTRTTRP